MKTLTSETKLTKSQLLQELIRHATYYQQCLDRNIKFKHEEDLSIYWINVIVKQLNYKLEKK